MPMRHVVGEVPQGGSPWPPIASYAFLSDCEVGAPVAQSGNVEWLCLPRFDAPSIFGSILDRDAGAFRLAPVDTSVPACRRYLPAVVHVVRADEALARDEPLIATPSATTVTEEAS